MARALVGSILLLALVRFASAQPAETVQLGGESWQHTRLADGDVFGRADGTTLTLTAVNGICSSVPRGAASSRPAWAPPVFWPTVDMAGGALALCLQRLTDTIVVTIKPGAAKRVDAALAPALAALAGQIRPATELTDLGISINPSIPIAQATSSSFVLALDGVAVAFGPSRGRGSCAFDAAMVLAQVARGTLEPVPLGYWGTLFRSDKGIYVCADLRDDYLTVVISPATVSTAAITEVLVEVRRAAVAAHGAPLDGEGGTLTLPRTGQVLHGVQGWKAVDGARFDVAGDVLVSTQPLAAASTYAVGVAEGPCSPSTASPLAADVARSIFPSELGLVWEDTREVKSRWRASACIATPDATATVSVIGSVASSAPPDADDLPALRTLISQIATSYGLSITSVYVPNQLGGGGCGGGGDGGGGGVGSARPKGKLSGHFVVYGGIIGITPEGGDRALGGLVGNTIRIAKAGGGIAASFDLEVGYGDDAFLGELRCGLGGALATRRMVFDVLAGLSAGSTGPAAALDGYVEASVGLYGDASVFWLGAMRAWGLGGADHDRVEMRLGIPTRAKDAYVLGLRYVRFGADAETMMGNGDAMLVTLGWGVTALN